MPGSQVCLAALDQSGGDGYKGVLVVLVRAQHKAVSEVCSAIAGDQVIGNGIVLAPQSLCRSSVLGFSAASRRSESLPIYVAFAKHQLQYFPNWLMNGCNVDKFA